MAHPGPDAGYGEDRRWGVSPERVAGTARNVGVALIGAALPAMTVALAAGVAVGTAPSALAGWVAAAMETPVTAVGGAAWVFRVAALAGLVGTWLLGFALVLEGYLGLE